PAVRAVTLRKLEGDQLASPAVAAERLRARLEAFEASRLEADPLMTAERRKALEATWPRDSSLERVTVSLDKAYDLLFTESEKREYSRSDFQTDLATFRRSSDCNDSLSLDEAVDFLQEMQ
ncbi:unnamed protein product, partial [Symbiodinium pilosum]